MPVLSSPPDLLDLPYHAPLGRGIMGAAFLQRSVLAWGDHPLSKSLIRPLPVPGRDARRVLALPIYHWLEDKGRQPQLNTRPGAVIGVVTFASDVVDSRISACQGNDEPARLLAQDAQALAQRSVINIINLLSRQRTDEVAGKPL
jgi:hypothetical protein